MARWRSGPTAAMSNTKDAVDSNKGWRLALNELGVTIDLELYAMSQMACSSSMSTPRLEQTELHQKMSVADLKAARTIIVEIAAHTESKTVGATDQVSTLDRSALMVMTREAAIPKHPTSMQAKVRYGIHRHEWECHGCSRGTSLFSPAGRCGTDSRRCPSRAGTPLVDIRNFCSSRVNS